MATLTSAGNGYFRLTNRNPGKLLKIYNNSQADGAIADQWTDTGCACQHWSHVKERIQ
jgi:hypothetical protein